MNIVDIIIFAIMSVSVVVGLYNGFILSALHSASFFLAWLLSLLFYSHITTVILSTFPSLMDTIILYAEGSAQLPTVEERMMGISTILPEKVIEIVEKVQLPNPFGRILVSDFSQTLEGIKTLGDYFDYTMAVVIINIFSFLLLFFLIKLVFLVLISITKTVVDLPVLKKCDGLVGAGFGLVRGFFMVYVLFSLIPVLLVLAPADIFNEFLDGSKMADFFHYTNIFTNFVKGR